MLTHAVAISLRICLHAKCKQRLGDFNADGRKHRLADYRFPEATGSSS